MTGRDKAIGVCHDNDATINATGVATCAGSGETLSSGAWPSASPSNTPPATSA